MHGKNTFVIRGVLIILTLLVYGTASADGHADSDSTHNEVNSQVRVTSDQKMEEVMVVGKKNFELPPQSFVDSIAHLKPNVELFPSLKLTRERPLDGPVNVHSNVRDTRFVEVFRVKF